MVIIVGISFLPMLAVNHFHQQFVGLQIPSILVDKGRSDGSFAGRLDAVSL